MAKTGHLLPPASGTTLHGIPTRSSGLRVGNCRIVSSTTIFPFERLLRVPLFFNTDLRATRLSVTFIYSLSIVINDASGIRRWRFPRTKVKVSHSYRKPLDIETFSCRGDSSEGFSSFQRHNAWENWHGLSIIHYLHRRHHYTANHGHSPPRLARPKYGTALSGES